MFIWRRMYALCCSLSVACLLQACNHPGCDGVAYTAVAGAPTLTQVSVLGSFPNDPWTILLALDFVQAAPTLSAGAALLYVNADTTPSRVVLQQAFAQSGLPAGAPSGRLGVLFPFNSSSVEDGDVVRLGTQLEDGAQADPHGPRSNCYNLDLAFSISVVPNGA